MWLSDYVIMWFPFGDFRLCKTLFSRRGAEALRGQITEEKIKAFFGVSPLVIRKQIGHSEPCVTGLNQNDR